MRAGVTPLRAQGPSPGLTQRNKKRQRRRLELAIIPMKAFPLLN